MATGNMPADWRSPRRSILIAIAVCLAALVAGGIAWRHASANRTSEPLQIGYWYWHRPFRLSADETKTLAGMGVSRLYIHAVTFHLHDGKVEPVMPQQYLSAAGDQKITLVLSFDYDIVRAFPRLSNADLASSICAQAFDAQQAAIAAGLHVGGVQLDLDCPTSRLPKYADLLQEIRPTLKQHGLNLSITALPTWLNSNRLLIVMDSVDDIAPQFYESNTPQTYDHLRTISDLDGLKTGLRQAESTGRPFYAGIPAYGHALVFDGSGKLVGLYHDQDAQDAIMDPAFHYVRSFRAAQDGTVATPATFSGETMVDLEARPPVPDETRPYHVVYDLPTPAIVSRYVDWIRAHRPANCRGIILYRYPGLYEADTVPLSGIKSALNGIDAQPRLVVKTKSKTEPWDAIEAAGGARTLQSRTMLEVTNAGNANTAVQSGEIEVTLTLDKPGLSRIERGGFDTMETFFVPPGTSTDNARRSSPERANIVRWTGHFLASGQTIAAGPIEADSGNSPAMHGRWTIHGNGSDRITGDFSTVNKHETQ